VFVSLLLAVAASPFEVAPDIVALAVAALFALAAATSFALVVVVAATSFAVGLPPVLGLVGFAGLSLSPQR
jgi:hypothetical protein